MQMVGLRVCVVSSVEQYFSLDMWHEGDATNIDNIDDIFEPSYVPRYPPHLHRAHTPWSCIMYGANYPKQESLFCASLWVWE